MKGVRGPRSSMPRALASRSRATACSRRPKPAAMWARARICAPRTDGSLRGGLLSRPGCCRFSPPWRCRRAAPRSGPPLPASRACQHRFGRSARARPARAPSDRAAGCAQAMSDARLQSVSGSSSNRARSALGNGHRRSSMPMSRKLACDRQLASATESTPRLQPSSQEGHHLSLPAERGERTAADHLPLRDAESRQRSVMPSSAA